MAAVQTTNANYYTKSGALSDNNLTTIYTCGDQKEKYADVVGISVSATSAFTDTVTVKRGQASDSTDYVLTFTAPVEIDFPLQIEGLPIHLTTGDTIKLQATAGASHTLHYHISINKLTSTPGK